MGFGLGLCVGLAGPTVGLKFGLNTNSEPGPVFGGQARPFLNVAQATAPGASQSRDRCSELLVIVNYYMMLQPS